MTVEVQDLGRETEVLEWPKTSSEPSTPSRPLRVFTMLEATSISGAVKPVMEFAREARRLEQGRLEIVIAAFARGSAENSLTRAVRKQGLPLELIRERHPWDWRVIPQLRNAIARWQPDIVWTHGCKSDFLVRVFSLQQSAKWIATHHGYTKDALRTRFYNRLDRWSLPGADCVLTVCSMFAEELVRKGVPADRIHVQQNPIRPNGLRPQPASLNRRGLGIAPDARIVLTVGRLSSEKGHADLIHAAAEWRRLSHTSPIAVIVVGDGRERRNLERLCSQMKLDEMVRFVGFQDDVRPYYGIADIFVLPSHSEGFPNVLLEAMDAGIPIVATAVGGIPQMVDDEVSALLVPARQPLALANAIDRLLADRNLEKRLTQGGRRILMLHTPEEYFRNIYVLFQEVVRTDD